MTKPANDADEEKYIRVHVSKYIDDHISRAKAEANLEARRIARDEVVWTRNALGISAALLAILSGIFGPSYIKSKVEDFFLREGVRPQLEKSVATEMRPLLEVLELRARAFQSREAFNKLKEVSSQSGQRQEFARLAVSEILAGYKPYRTLSYPIDHIRLIVNDKGTSFTELPLSEKFRRLRAFEFPHTQISSLAYHIMRANDNPQVIRLAVELLRDSDSLPASMTAGIVLERFFRTTFREVEFHQFEKWIQLYDDGKLHSP